WEGFSRAEDDLGNRYLILCQVEKGRPGLCRFLGSEMLTQTLFPALVPDARRRFLTNPGHVITHASTVDGQIRGRPRTYMVTDGSVVTVELRGRWGRSSADLSHFQGEFGGASGQCGQFLVVDGAQLLGQFQ